VPYVIVPTGATEPLVLQVPTRPVDKVTSLYGLAGTGGWGQERGDKKTNPFRGERLGPCRPSLPPIPAAPAWGAGAAAIPVWRFQRHPTVSARAVFVVRERTRT